GGRPLVVLCDAQSGRLVLQVQPRAGSGGVLANVGQGLLDRPVRGDVGGGRQAADRSADIVLDTQPGAAEGRDQIVEAGQPDGGFGGGGPLTWPAQQPPGVPPLLPGAARGPPRWWHPPGEPCALGRSQRR